MSRPCGCLGGNENCTFCYGSGYIPGENHVGISRERREWSAGSVLPGVRRSYPTELKRSESTQRQSSAQARQQAVKRPLTYSTTKSYELGVGCNYCTSRFNTPAALDRHVESDHVAEANDHSEAARAKPFVRVKGVVWERERFRKENPKVLAAANPVAQQPLPAPTRPAIPAPRVEAKAPLLLSPSGNPLVQCKDCPSKNNKVRVDHIEKHMRDVHGVGRTGPKPRSIPTPARKLSKRVVPGEAARNKALNMGSGVNGSAVDDGDERVGELDNYSEERRLDGARDFWQIREEGRFGSHPSFDSCDDESAP